MLIDHVYICIYNIYNITYINFLEGVIALWALRAGPERAETQPKDLWLDDNKTPDIDLILGGRRILVDVAVVHPCAPSYAVEAHNPLGGSATMVLTKDEKYANLADSLGAEVVPVVIETFGASLGSSRTFPSVQTVPCMDSA